MTDASEPDPEPLSGTDNAWRRMDERTNRTEITILATFAESLSFERLEELCRERVLPFRRFRQRVVDPGPGRRCRWERDPRFDLANHLSHVALPEPGAEPQLQAFVSDVMSRPLDRDKPLWELYLVETGGEGNAIVMSIHHALADGFALLFVLLWLADEPTEIDLPLGEMPDPPDNIDAAGSTDTGTGDPFEDRPNPSEGALPTTPASLWRALKRGANLAASGIRVLTMEGKRDTPLSGELGVRKHVAWTDPIDLERVQTIGDAHDATINEVLLAATAGAFRRYLASVQDGPVEPDATLRVTVPLNLKPLRQRTEDLGNYFGLGYLNLPVGVVNVDERLRRITEHSGRMKQGTEAYLLYLTFNVLGRLPARAQSVLEDLTPEKSTAVVTNVPGPVDDFSVEGNRVEDIMFWVPQAHGCSVGLSIFTYDGRVRIGIAADAGLVPEPFRLADAFATEIDAMTDELS